MNSMRMRVFVVFALGYFVSYLFRDVNVGLAPVLTRDLGFSATDIGMVTSLYFLGFAGAQIPGGILLDYFGPRRATACIMLVAAVGILVFGSAHGLAAVMSGRLLIGIGVSVCLSGAFKATAEHYDVEQLPLVNGFIMAIGGLGGVAAGSPLAWLLSITSWRNICSGLAVITVVVALVILAFGPSHQRAERQRTNLAAQIGGTWEILCSGAFWKIACFSALSLAVFNAMQSLWVGTFLRDVVMVGAPDASAQVASLVSILGLAFVGGNIGFGALARTLERKGVPTQVFSGVLMMVFIIVQAVIILRVPLPEKLLWSIYGALGGAGILTFTVLAERYPVHMVGRANTTFNLLIFVLIFGLQVLIGAAFGHWQPHDGHYPLVAHRSIWVTLIAAQLAAAVWYFLPARHQQTAMQT